MHFMIQTFKIIIFAILFSNIITKQNENTTTKNNTHTMKESNDDEYVDIKNKELDNNIKRNEFDEFKDNVLKNADILIALITIVLAVCVCMLVLVIMNCSRWENISECSRQCIKRNYLIVRNCCREDPKPSYHPEHSCEDFCRWCCTDDYYNFRKSIPNPHQPKRAERSERAECAQCAELAERAERAEVVAEPPVTYDGSNVSIQERHANFPKSNPNPDHQPERAERAQFAERAQRVERAEVVAEPPVTYDGSNVSIQEHHASFRRFNPNPHQPERAERAQCVERTQVHAKAEQSVIYDGSNVSIQEHHANFRRSNPNPDHQPERAECAERAQFAERAQRAVRALVHAEAEPSIIYDRSNVSIQEHHANFRRFNPNPHQPERAERAQCIERTQVHAKAEQSVIYDRSNVSIQEHHANFRRTNPNPDHQPERAERAERAQFAERAQRAVRALVHAEAEPSIIYDRSNVSIQEHHANFRRFNPNAHQPERAERAERAQFAERAQRAVRALVHAEAEPSIIYDRSNVPIQEHHANFRRTNPNPDHQPERAEHAERAQFAERAQRAVRALVHAEAEPSIIYDRSNVSIQEHHANFRRFNPNAHQPERAERAERAQFAERAQRAVRALVHAEAEPSIIYDRSNVSIQEHHASFRRFNPKPHQPERAERAQCVERTRVHAKAEQSVIYDGSNVSIQEHHASFRRFNPKPHQPERAERAQCVERTRVHAKAEQSVIYDGSNVSIQERHANFRKSNPNPDHQPERAERAERAQFAERAQRVERAQVHAEAEPSIICDWTSVSITKTVFMETDF